MVPFVLAQPSRAPLVTVASDALEPKRRKDLLFFEERGIDLFGADSSSVTFTKTTVTKSTQTSIPTTDSDETTFEQVDDNDID